MKTVIEKSIKEMCFEMELFNVMKETVAIVRFTGG